jgi:hypothetical protein
MATHGDRSLAGLKILRPKGHAGSSPALGTNFLPDSAVISGPGSSRIPGRSARRIAIAHRMVSPLRTAAQSGTGIELPGPIVGDALLCRQYEQVSLLTLTAAALTVSVLASLPTLVVM